MNKAVFLRCTVLDAAHGLLRQSVPGLGRDDEHSSSASHQGLELVDDIVAAAARGRSGAVAAHGREEVHGRVAPEVEPVHVAAGYELQCTRKTITCGQGICSPGCLNGSITEALARRRWTSWHDKPRPARYADTVTKTVAAPD